MFLRLLLLLSLALPLLATEAAAGKKFNLELDDRVDPVAPGDEMVFEVDVKVGGSVPAPDVRVSFHLPDDSTFVEARRQPDFSEVTATLDGGVVHFDLGEQVPCGKKDLPVCTELWVTVALDPDAPDDTVVPVTADLSSSAPGAFPTDSETIYTSIGSLAIRKGKVLLGGSESRVKLSADVGRSGWGNLLLPAPPTIQPAAGVRVMIGEVGEPALLDLDLDASDIECRGSVRMRCTPVDKAHWKALGLTKLKIVLERDFIQRNNASVGIQASVAALPADFGPAIYLRLEADGAVYEDEAVFDQPKPTTLHYKHSKREP